MHLPILTTSITSILFLQKYNTKLQYLCKSWTYKGLLHWRWAGIKLNQFACYWIFPVQTEITINLINCTILPLASLPGRSVCWRGGVISVYWSVLGACVQLYDIWLMIAVTMSQSVISTNIQSSGACTATATQPAQYNCGAGAGANKLQTQHLNIVTKPGYHYWLSY